MIQGEWPGISHEDLMVECVKCAAKYCQHCYAACPNCGATDPDSEPEPEEEIETIDVRTLEQEH